jgi:diacylglycerol kinase family enzyme
VTRKRGNESRICWQVILNPHAGSGKGKRDKEKIVSVLNQSGLLYNLHESEYKYHTIELSKDLAVKGATHFIVAGGDGTLNETVNGIFSGKNNHSGFGFDAMVAIRANTLKDKGLSGLRVYLESFLWSYINYKAHNIMVAIDNENLK